MRRLLLLSFGLFLFALPSRAQSVDASVGYSYFRLGGSGGINQNGVSGSVAYNPNRWLGIVGDFGGYHASPGGVSLNTYTYLLGGGVDIGLLPHLALRPQLDYVGLRNSGQTANCTRLSLGFVVHF
jgi:hypothetical protein